MSDTAGPARNHGDTRSEPRTDRRAERSKRALWQALMALLQDHDWGEINVQMICDRADVARSTFYAHFPTKQDVLDMGFAVGLAEVERHAAAAPGPLPTLHWLVGHLASVAGFQRRLQGTAAGSLIMTRFRAMTSGLMRRDLEARGQTVTNADLIFVMGGIFAATDLWLANACEEPQATLIRRLERQIKAVLG